MAVIKNYIGEVFGTFKVIEDLGMYTNKDPTKKNRHILKCKCIKCGFLREGLIYSFRQKGTKCECEKKPLNTKEWSRIYKIHHGMMSRCYNKKVKDYKKYGAIGVVVCDEWLASCEAFYKWSLENNYAENLSIDRVNNKGNYEPSNCRWATTKEQMRNRNCSVGIEKAKEIKRLLKEGLPQVKIAEIVGTNPANVRDIKYKRYYSDIII